MRHQKEAVSEIEQREIYDPALMPVMEEWEQTFDTIPDIIVVIDNHYRIKRANKALAVKLGLRREDITGSLCYKVIHGTEAPPVYCRHVKVIRKGKENIAEVYENKLKDHYIVSSTPICGPDGNVTGVVKVFREISARKKMEEQLKAAAITDDLTGLFNRRGFIALAEQHCKLAARTRRKVSLLYMDLDNMKLINDEHGHKAGDQALRDTAGIIKKVFRKSDIIARIGGDEFVVLLTDPSKNDIHGVISRHVQNNVNKFNEQSGLSYKLSLSMGFACFDPDRPCSIEDLLSRADALMYEDKKRRSKNAALPALLRAGMPEISL